MSIRLGGLLLRPWRWQHLGILLLVLITLALHFSIIMQPDVPTFDEEHYVPDARSILSGGGTLHPVHPPLSKLIIALGMLMFGDNPFGWRFFPVLMGTLSVVLFYLICRQLGASQRTTLLATFLLTFENLNFVQGGVAMLDAPVPTQDTTKAM